ncbi:MAG: PaaI family thioesterase [Acidimicrobiia bacterium]|nr:PaaI family thioesterase [Acidimicrobiia bacterium]MYG71339.1 PaaI family thioesterase [Acidimicrobiia bacterium]
MPENPPPSGDYPPEHHILRDLKMVNERPERGWAISRVPLSPAVLTTSGIARLGVIGITADAAGALTALIEAQPDRIATQDLSYTASGFARQGPLIASCRLVRAGQRLITVTATVADGCGSDDPEQAQPVGQAILSFSLIPNRPGYDDLSPLQDPAMERRTLGLATSGFGDSSLWDAIGLDVVDAAAGVVRVPKTDYVRNSFGTITGGVMIMAAEAAAELAAQEALGAPVAAMSLNYRFLDQTRIGPAQTQTTVLRDDNQRAVAIVRLIDSQRDRHLAGYAVIQFAVL